MNKKQERIATIALAAFLIGMFCYQVAYGATTEDNYQYGYKVGRQGYDCSNFDADCDNGLTSCDYGYVHGTGSGNQTFTVTNKTACFDGFVNGWEHWCNTDLALCAKYVLSNVFPGQLANNQTSIYLCLKDGSDNASGPSNVLPPPQLSKHCGGVVSDISGPWIVVRPHPFNPAIYANITNFNQNVTKES